MCNFIDINTKKVGPISKWMFGIMSIKEHILYSGTMW